MKKLMCLLILALVSIFVLASCAKAKGIESVSINENGELVLVYTDGSTENLGIIKGEKGEQGAQGDPGAPGDKGDNGTTPTIQISTDGYWIINGVKTEHKAIGKDGIDGEDGKDGADGNPGANGSDGFTPTIEISTDGYWIINGVKTKHKAIGKDGIDGEDGKDFTPVDDNPQGLDFFLKDDGTYVVEIGGAKYLSKIVVPATYKGRAVTEIGSFGGDELRVNEILTEITIPNSVTKIGDLAFCNCAKLAKVVLPDSITTIGKYAFALCDSLKDVYIQSKLESVGEYAFASYIQNVYINDLSDWISSNFLYDSSTPMRPGVNLYLNGELVTDIEIPTDIDEIGAYTFTGYQYLTSIVIPNNIIYIGDGVFDGCSNIQSVYIGNGVTEIGNYAFSECANLQSVYMSSSVKKIGDYAFYECKKLTDFQMGENVETIGRCAFNYCPIVDLTIPETLYSVGAENYMTVENLYAKNIETIYLLNSIWPHLNYNNLYLDNPSLITEIKYILPDDPYISNPNPLGYIYEDTLVLKPPRRYGYNFVGWYDGTDYIYTITKEYLNEKKVSVITLEAVWESVFTYEFLYEAERNIYGIEGYGVITGLSGSTYFEQLEIPDRIDNIQIIAIGENAFAECDYLCKVIIPSSIKEVGANAFGNYDKTLNVYYKDTAVMWAKIAIANDNVALKNATVYFHSLTAPTDDGNYWCETDSLVSQITYDRLYEIVAVFNGATELGMDFLSFILEYTVSDSYINAIEPKFAQANKTQDYYRTRLYEDCILALEYFEKELKYDFATAKFYFDTSTAPYSEWEHLFNDEIFCFLFYEGYITAEYGTDWNGKKDYTKILRFDYSISMDMLENMDMDAAINFVYNDMVATRFDTVLLYYYTGAWLQEHFEENSHYILREKFEFSYMSQEVFIWF